MSKKPIRLMIKSLYNSMSPKEQSIADYILDHPDEVAHNSISEIAGSLQIAVSTIFQFTRKLGFNGYRDFRVALLTESPESSSVSINENILETDTDIVMARKVFDYNIQALNDTKNLLNEADLIRATDLMLAANMVLFAGIGGSEIIAADAFHKFMRAPIQCFHITDYHIQLMQASLLKKGDCAFIISHTGITKESIQIAKAAKKNGASIIVITSYPNSELAKLGDVVFLSISEETKYRSEALSSRITQLSIIDAIYVILMFRDEQKSTDSLHKVRSAIRTIKQT